MDSESLSEFFEFDETNQQLPTSTSPDDIFSVLEALEAAGGVNSDFNPTTSSLDESTHEVAGSGFMDNVSKAIIINGGDIQETTMCSGIRLVSQKSTSSISAGSLQEYSENELTAETSLLLHQQKSKRRKLTTASTRVPTASSTINNYSDHHQQQEAAAAANQLQDIGLHRMSHITVERNRRKQMNEHLTVLRSLMPCFYVKRGDQASIIGGVVDYISELQQVLQSLEAKKQRKSVYSEVLSPRLVVSSPRSSPLSPRKPPLSPRLSLPISPRTPQQPTSPYKAAAAASVPPRFQQHGLPSPCSSAASSTSSSVYNNNNNNNNNIGGHDMSVNELVANSRSAIAEVEVKFSGPNVLLKTMSPRLPGQVVKIISAIEELSLEILQVEITTSDQTMINSFTIKIGIECQLSAEELAQQIQQTFC